MTAPTISVDRPLRRDAAENRERLLDAAAQVFAERGLDASVEEIAKVAGVGLGTLYRRFPTKDALIDALVRDVIEALYGFAGDAATHTDGTGLEAFLESAGAYQATHRGCLPRLWTSGNEPEKVMELRARVASLLEDAQRHGKVRAELTPTDVTMTLWSIRGVIQTTGHVTPNAWRRQLEILIAGLRPAADALTVRAMTQGEVDRVIDPK